MVRTKTISVTINEMRINEMDYYIDGTKFRNRSHMIDTIVKEWLEKQRKPSQLEFTPKKSKPKQVEK